mmetsp:Transcript_6974/g.15802  ORF Transcript_6974/g.15802 Transcript_6974/m.15802 type:complete len:211 (-) Transcript_6974:700-1332(-)
MGKDNLQSGVIAANWRCLAHCTTEESSCCTSRQECECRLDVCLTAVSPHQIGTTDFRCQRIDQCVWHIFARLVNTGGVGRENDTNECSLISGVRCSEPHAAFVVASWSCHTRSATHHGQSAVHRQERHNIMDRVRASPTLTRKSCNHCPTILEPHCFNQPSGDIRTGLANAGHVGIQILDNFGHIASVSCIKNGPPRIGITVSGQMALSP